MPELLLFKCNGKKIINITAGGDPNAWRLGRIEETDHETPV